MIGVGINGYGTIGRRVAHAVSLQDDMYVTGIVKNSPDYVAKFASKSFNIYVPDEGKVREFEENNIKVRGTVNDLINESDLIVDGTPEGMGEKNIKLYFSGGRGYHVHIESDNIYNLDSDARREIGDYIRIENLNIDELKKLDDVRVEYGILKKLNIYISDFFNNIDENYVKNIFRKDTIHYLKYINNKYYKEKKIIDFLKNQNGNKFKLIGKEDSNIKYNELILKSLLNNFKKASMAEIDEPVTTDIHRLIRFPLSLHGKTGLMVKPLKIGDLKDFMPLNDAIPDVFKNGSRKINLGIDKFEITMNNENYKVEKGINEAPLYLAIFAVAINVAEFVD